MKNKSLIKIATYSMLCSNLFSWQLTKVQIEQARTKYLNICSNYKKLESSYKAEVLYKFIQKININIKQETREFNPYTNSNFVKENYIQEDLTATTKALKFDQLETVIGHLITISKNPVGFELLKRLSNYDFKLQIGYAETTQSFFLPLDERLYILALDYASLEKFRSSDSVIKSSGSITKINITTDEILFHEMVHMLHFIENNFSTDENIGTRKLKEFFNGIDGNILDMLYSNNEEFITCFGIKQNEIDVVSRAAYSASKYGVIDIAHNDLTGWNDEIDVKAASEATGLPIAEIKKKINETRANFNKTIFGIIEKIKPLFQIFK